MTIELKVTIEDEKTLIQLPEGEGGLTLYAQPTLPVLKPENFYLYFSHRRLTGYVYHGLWSESLKADEPDEIFLVDLPDEIDGAYFNDFLRESGLGTAVMTNPAKSVQIPPDKRVAIEEYVQKIQTILALLGFRLNSVPSVEKPSPSSKPRHRWSKEIATVDFFIDTRESQASIRWQKRNELLIKAGATMKPVASLNKDGSVGFAAKMGAKIRSEHQNAIKDFVTTEDIVLKSVNEVGLFLYFGGTNSWLEIMDKEGKTLHEWCVVNKV